jgi:hypothetical protein
MEEMAEHGLQTEAVAAEPHTNVQPETQEVTPTDTQEVPPTDAHPPADAPAPELPDYMTDANAVLGDTTVAWRYGKPPDYTKTRKVYAESKCFCHP